MTVRIVTTDYLDQHTQQKNAEKYIPKGKSTKRKDKLGDLGIYSTLIIKMTTKQETVWEWNELNQLRTRSSVRVCERFKAKGHTGYYGLVRRPHVDK